MSILRTTSITCADCGGAVDFELVHSVNADRRPDLREAILDGSFQRQVCPACGTESRIEPLFNYLNLGRQQWIGVWPRTSAGDWPVHVAQAREAFAAAFGAEAPPGARALGEGMNCRVVFGWAALREKLLLAGEGLDDVTIEIAKLALLRDSRAAPLTSADLRLMAADAQRLLFSWQELQTEQMLDSIEVSRSLVSELQDDADWQPQRAMLAAEPFVDFKRLFMAPAEAAA